MICGDKVGLRARREADVALLHAELYEDTAMQALLSERPWRPLPPGSSASPYAVEDPTDEATCFSVVDLASDELVGDALLWGIDAHNRLGHLGVALRPKFHGQGMGKDVVRVLCHYGFTLRGLHRLQVDTLASNTAMIRAAVANGFVQEGTLRRSAWVHGEFVDKVVLGLLADEWRRA